MGNLVNRTAAIAKTMLTRTLNMSCGELGVGDLVDRTAAPARNQGTDNRMVSDGVVSTRGFQGHFCNTAGPKVFRVFVVLSNQSGVSKMAKVCAKVCAKVSL